jgi:hypothetical protein
MNQNKKQEQKEEATPEQKKIFKAKKKKQFPNDVKEFDPDSDQDTTGKSEAFKSDRINGPGQDGN